MFKKGDFVTINKQVGVVIFCEGELGEYLQDHTAVWFGTLEKGAPEVWTIPTEYLENGPNYVLKH